MKSSNVDHDAARELELYIDNDSALYHQKDAFLANVHRKMKAGKYNPAEAVKLWMYYVDRGAKAYAKEFDSAANWTRLFSRATRHHVAERYPPVHAASRDHLRANRVRPATRRVKRRSTRDRRTRR